MGFELTDFAEDEDSFFIKERDTTILMVRKEDGAVSRRGMYNKDPQEMCYVSIFVYGFHIEDSNLTFEYDAGGHGRDFTPSELGIVPDSKRPEALEWIKKVNRRYQKEGVCQHLYGSLYPV